MVLIDVLSCTTEIILVLIRSIVQPALSVVIIKRFYFLSLFTYALHVRLARHVIAKYIANERINTILLNIRNRTNLRILLKRASAFDLSAIQVHKLKWENEKKHKLL